jgi:hypothetical protein
MDGKTVLNVYFYRMKKILFIFSVTATFTLVGSIFSCQDVCVNEVFLETLEMNLEVNSENLGIFSGEVKNNGDTIKSEKNQFYNSPEFRRFGSLQPAPNNFFVTSAYAAECPDRIEYTSRMDLTKTRFSLNVDYDGSALGVGIIPADSNLLTVPAIKNAYLQEFSTSLFLAAGADGPLTIEPEFFGPINNQWVTFSFYFEELNGDEFFDEAIAYVKIAL